jgi:hypothetical protein
VADRGVGGARMCGVLGAGAFGWGGVGIGPPPTAVWAVWDTASRPPLRVCVPACVWVSAPVWSWQHHGLGEFRFGSRAPDRAFPSFAATTLGGASLGGLSGAAAVASASPKPAPSSALPDLSLGSADAPALSPVAAPVATPSAAPATEGDSVQRWLEGAVAPTATPAAALAALAAAAAGATAAPAAAPPPALEPWVCSACTFMNAPTREHCDMCMSPNPATVAASLAAVAASASSLSLVPGPSASTGPLVPPAPVLPDDLMSFVMPTAGKVVARVSSGGGPSPSPFVASAAAARTGPEPEAGPAGSPDSGPGPMWRRLARQSSASASVSAGVPFPGVVTDDAEAVVQRYRCVGGVGGAP